MITIKRVLKTNSKVFTVYTFSSMQAAKLFLMMADSPSHENFII